MIRHYLSLAWQQLEKYRLQSVVSIVSLAIGFACFALASMWIKYETTYDAFHKDAENLYIVRCDREYNVLRRINVQKLHEMPQLEQLTQIYQLLSDSINGLNWEESRRQGEWVVLDTNFVSLVGLRIKEGTTSFVHNPQEVAVSDVLAARLWGDESPIGKTLTTVERFNRGTFRRTRTVSAVFYSWGRHSNFRFDKVSCFTPEVPEDCYNGYSYMMAHISPKVDIDELNSRLDTTQLRNKDGFGDFERANVVPITKLRHSTESYERSGRAKINHIYLFALASCLLILCGLLNYLTMFINRLFIRKREIALRIVFGASGRNIIVQFIIEYGLLLAIAMVFGLVVINLSLEWFLKMTALPHDTSYLYSEILVYLLFVTVLSLLISLPCIWYFRRQSLQSSMAGVGALTRYYIFRRFSTGIQIAICIFSIFCTIVFMKQLDCLRSNKKGFEIENRMILRCYSRDRSEENVELLHFLKQCPEVDTVYYSMTLYFPYTGSGMRHVSPIECPDLKDHTVIVDQIISKDLVDFYGIQLVEGRWLNDADLIRDEGSDWLYCNCILINEALVHLLGWTDPLEKTFIGDKIVGVVKDVYNQSPTTPAEPTMYRFNPFEADTKNMSFILVKYKPNMKQVVKDKVEAYAEKRGLKNYNTNYWMDCEEAYEKNIQSERNLQKLLNIITGVCILIALFGVWSMIMLTCKQRRKEIAVRKVFGATTKDILDMFFLEYMALQGAAALVAFPVGYACMKPWLEQYVVQTSIPWWIYVGIFLAVALLVALCVGWRVWKTATAHPADEIK